MPGVSKGCKRALRQSKSNRQGGRDLLQHIGPVAFGDLTKQTRASARIPRAVIAIQQPAKMQLESAVDGFACLIEPAPFRRPRNQIETKLPASFVADAQIGKTLPLPPAA